MARRARRGPPLAGLAHGRDAASARSLRSLLFRQTAAKDAALAKTASSPALSRLRSRSLDTAPAPVPPKTPEPPATAAVAAAEPSPTEEARPAAPQEEPAAALPPLEPPPSPTKACRRRRAPSLRFQPNANWLREYAAPPRGGGGAHAPARTNRTEGGQPSQAARGHGGPAGGGATSAGAGDRHRCRRCALGVHPASCRSGTANAARTAGESPTAGAAGRQGRPPGLRAVRVAAGDVAAAALAGVRAAGSVLCGAGRGLPVLPGARRGLCLSQDARVD